MPYNTPIPSPKAWWNPEIRELRKGMLQRQRALGKSNTTAIELDQGYIAKIAYLKARNSYFQAIKKAKRDYWNSFLEKEDPKSIFKALAYTRDYRVEKIPTILGESTFLGKARVFRETLFPRPPRARELDQEGYSCNRDYKWPRLEPSELKLAYSTKIKGKTPGPDSISQEIITRAYSSIPGYFYRLYSCLIDIGYHPSYQKQATGAILRKPSKPDYTLPKAYRVISLLNCLGKISEQILAQRLGYLAETTELLYPT